jgi:TPR repeat protein
MEGKIKRMNKDYYILFWRARKEERYHDCLPILLEGVEAGNATAMWLLARCYFEGVFVKENKSSALEWFKKSAALGNPIAMVYLSVEYQRDRRFDQSFEWAKKVLQTNSYHAIGVCFGMGLGVRSNLDRAIECYLKAINEQNSIESFYELGCLYDAEPSKLEDGYDWYKKGAIEGDSLCQCSLGYIHECFKPLPNRDECLVWYRKAAKQRSTHAMHELINILSGRYGIQSKTEAWYWFNKLKEIDGDFTQAACGFFKYFDRCLASCYTLICIRKYRVDTPLHVFPKDVVVYLAKILWETRCERVWEN